jgi:hypothetical protein
VNAGEVPKPVQVGPSSRRIAWIEEEVDAYLDALVAKRSSSPVEQRKPARKTAAPAAPRKARRRPA